MRARWWRGIWEVYSEWNSGHNVNVAARIESQAKPPQPPLLVSGEVAKRVASVFEMECVGAAALKGVGHEMKLFTLKKAHPDETATK